MRNKYYSYQNEFMILQRQKNFQNFMVHQRPLSYVIFVHCHYKFMQNIISYFSFYIFDVIYIYIHKVQKCLSKVSILSRCVLRCKYRSCRLFPSVLKISFMCHKLVMFNVQCKLERVRP